MTAVNQVITELNIDASGASAGAAEYEAATHRAESAVLGLSSAEEKAKRIQDAAVKTTTNQTESLSRLTKSFQNLQAAIDPVAKAEIAASRQIEKATRIADAAVRRGIANQQQADSLLSATRAKTITDINAVREAHIRKSQAVASGAELEQSAMNSATSALDLNTVAQNRNTKAVAKGNFQRTNLIFQLQDIGVSLAGGQNPLLVAAQQGSQISTIYGPGEGGLGRAFKETGKIAVGLVTKLWPVALVVGTIGVAMAGLVSEIETSTGVAVTFGDTFKAVFQVAGRAIYDELQPAINAISPWFSNAWDLIKSGAKDVFNFLVRAVKLFVPTISHTLSAIPILFRVTSVDAANFFIDSINWMTRKTLSGLNKIISAANDFASMFGSLLPENATLSLFDTGSLGLDRLAGGSDVVKELNTHMGKYQATVKEIAATDYAGEIFNQISDQAVLNANERIGELTKTTKGAGKAAKEAARQFEQFQSSADGFAEELFPAEYAIREANELIGLLETYGDKLDQFQRIAVDSRIADLFEASRLGLRELEKDTVDTAKDIADSIEQTLGSALSSLFDGPIESADEFFNKLTSGFASIAQKNIEGLFDGLLTGGRSAANDNDPWASLRSAVEDGAKQGAAKGGLTGIVGGLTTFFGGANTAGGQGLGPGGFSNVAGSALGGVSLGAQTQNPVMGGLGGALSGFAAGGPIGAIVGGIAGIFGGIFGRKRAARQRTREAIQKLDENRGSIENLIATGDGRSVGAITENLRAYNDEIDKAVNLANAAGDRKLVERLQSASNSFFTTLERDFIAGFDAMILAFESGFGANSPFIAAQVSVQDLRSELKGFVNDAEELAKKSAELNGGLSVMDTDSMITEAQQAAQAMALTMLSGVRELTGVETEIQRLQGTAAGLQITLEELGLGSEEAERKISDGLMLSLAKLSDQYIGGLNTSINELSGFGVLNEITAAQLDYQIRLKDAASLGLDGSLALSEFNLSLRDVIGSSDLTASQIQILGKAYPAVAALVGTLSDANVSERLATAQSVLRDTYDSQVTSLQSVIDQTETFIASLAKFRSSMRLSAVSPLSQRDQLSDAAKQFSDVAKLAASGDVDAFNELTNVSQSYLDEARAYYASSEDYFKIWQEVDKTLSNVEADAGKQLSQSQRQLEVLNRQVDGLLTVNQSVMSVVDAIRELNTAQSASDAAFQTRLDTYLSSDTNGIQSAYQTYLGRTGDASEIGYWQGQINSGGSLGGVTDAIANSVEANAFANSIGRFADGGMHAGGLRIVGERGPELEATGSAKIFNHQQTKSLLSGGDNSEVVAELRQLRADNLDMKRAVERLANIVGLSDQETRKIISEGNEIASENSSMLRKVASQ